MLSLILFGLSCFYHFTISQRITEVPTPELISGVSPIWDDCSQSLYFTDYLKPDRTPSIFRYDFNENKVYSAYVDGSSAPVFIIPVRDCKKYPNFFVIGVGHDVKMIFWPKNSEIAHVIKTIFSLDQNDPSNTLGIAVPGPNGQLYVGEYFSKLCSGPSNSSVYMYSKQKGLQRLFGGVKDTDGLAIDKKRNKFYHLQTCTQSIAQFKWDPHTGDICNGRTAIDLTKFNSGAEDAYPVGLTVDTDGMLYVPNYADGTISRVDPRKHQVIGRYNIGNKGLTSATFGGPNLDILYAVGGDTVLDVDSGKVDFNSTKNGYLFMITDIGAKGFKSSRLLI